MRLFLFFSLLVLNFSAFGQKFKQERYKNFDRRLFHFGFMLGFNTMDFTLYPELNNYENYGILSVENDAQPGGQLGILTTMRIGTPMVRLRFIQIGRASCRERV